jgi:predicted glycoside hydrolase/deacetylase ChbG (UPF0249 family)
VISLIVNADDFGLTSGVNQSIQDLHHSGALSSATLMADAKSTLPAAGIATLRSQLGVGCHVVLVDGTATLPARSLPELTLPSGSFRPTLGRFALAVTLGRIPEIEIQIEAMAQIRRLQALGLRVTHVDTHKHTHMYPRVLRPLLLAAIECGVPAIRNPFEPEWALQATPGAPFVRRTQVRLLRTRLKMFSKLVKKAGLATTDGAIGVLATGTLDVRTLHVMLAAMPPGIWELVCHPGYPDKELDSVRTRLRESRQIEHAALQDIIPQFLHDRPDVSLINFNQIQDKNS